MDIEEIRDIIEPVITGILLSRWVIMFQWIYWRNIISYFDFVDLDVFCIQQITRCRILIVSELRITQFKVEWSVSIYCSNILINSDRTDCCIRNGPIYFQTSNFESYMSLQLFYLTFDIRTDRMRFIVGVSLITVIDV